MQKRPKTWSRTSSTAMAPTRRPKAWAARRKSSARSSISAIGLARKELSAARQRNSCWRCRAWVSAGASWSPTRAAATRSQMLDQGVQTKAFEGGNGQGVFGRWRQRAAVDQIGLVEEDQQAIGPAGQLRWRRGGVRVSGIHQPEHEIGRPHPLPGAPDAFLLHLADRRADAGRIAQNHGETLEAPT